MTHIKKTIKHIRRPKSSKQIKDGPIAGAVSLVGEHSTVQTIKKLLSGRFRFSLNSLELSLAIEETNRNRISIVRLLNRAIKEGNYA